MKIQITENDINNIARRVIHKLSENIDYSNLPSDISLKDNGKYYLNLHQDSESDINNNIANGNINDDIGEYNGWPIYSLPQAREEFAQRAKSLLGKETLTEDDITAEVVLTIYKEGFFNKWLTSNSLYTSSVKRNDSTSNAKMNKGNALEFILGKNIDNKSDSDLINAELKAYNINSPEVMLFGLAPYNILNNDKPITNLSEFNEILSAISNSTQITKHNHTLNKNGSQDKTDYNTNSNTYASVSLNEDGSRVITITTQYMSTYNGNKLNTLKCIYEIEYVKRELENGRVTYEEDIDTENAIDVRQKAGKFIGKTILDKIKHVLHFTTVTIGVNNTNNFKIDNTKFNELFSYAKIDSYEIPDNENILYNFINCISNGDILVGYVIDTGRLNTTFRIKNTVDSFHALYGDNESNFSTMIDNDIQKTINSLPQQDYVRQKIQDRTTKPQKSNGNIEDLITRMLKYMDSNKEEFTEKGKRGFKSLNPEFNRGKESKIFKNAWEEAKRKYYNNYPEDEFPDDYNLNNLDENKKQNIMKIQITENDIRLMTNKALKRINEMRAKIDSQDFSGNISMIDAMYEISNVEGDEQVLSKYNLPLTVNLQARQTEGVTGAGPDDFGGDIVVDNEDEINNLAHHVEQIQPESEEEQQVLEAYENALLACTSGSYDDIQKLSTCFTNESMNESKKIKISESDIQAMTQKALKRINEVRIADRMGDPNDPAYEEGWNEYRKKHSGSYADPTLMRHWKERGKYDYYNSKSGAGFNKNQAENVQKIVEIAQSFSVIPFESLDLDKYNGVHFWDNDMINHQYIVLDKHDCNGPATEAELQESIDRAKDVFTKMAEAIKDALPWKGTSEYSFYEKNPYKRGSYKLGEPRPYKDIYAYKFNSLEYPTRDVLSKSTGKNASDIRNGIDWSNWTHQWGQSYKGKDSKQDFFQDYPENSFDNHVEGWVITADVLSYIPLYSAKDIETIGEKMIDDADVQIAFKFDEQYNTDYRAMKTAESNAVEPSSLD